MIRVIGVGVGVGVQVQVSVTIIGMGMVRFWRGEETLETAKSADGLPLRHSITITITVTITALTLALTPAQPLAIALRLQLEIHQKAGELKASIQVGYPLRRERAEGGGHVGCASRRT
jgi:hypothetical protein